MDTKTTLTWVLKDEVSGKAKGIGGALMGVVNPATLAAAGIAAVAGGLALAAKAAIDEEINIEKLNASLEANVEGWNGNTDAIEALIDKQQDLAFSDDEQRESLALLLAGTKDVTEAQELQVIAMDLARLKNVDLATATNAVAKASAGSTRELKALGIEFDESATSAEVLAQVSAAAAGQSAAYASTTAGKWEVLQNRFGDVVEEIGTAVLPILTKLLDWVLKVALPAFKQFADWVGPRLKAAFRIAAVYFEWVNKNILTPIITNIRNLIYWVSQAIGWINSLVRAGQATGLFITNLPTAPRTSGAIPRQHGGPVEAGGAYLVGEHGPELLQMGRQSGTVIPGGGMGGGSPVEIPVILDGYEVGRVIDRRIYALQVDTGTSIRPR